MQRYHATSALSYNARPPAGRGDPTWPSAATRSNDRGPEAAAGVVEPRHTVHRRRRERGAAARVAVPDAASAVGRGRAEAPAIRPVNPGLLLGERLGADGGQGEDHRYGLHRSPRLRMGTTTAT